MSKRVVTLDFITVNDLYVAYMPFVSGGGVFIPTQQPFEIGEEVGLDLRLLEDQERHQLDAIVMWLTPVGAQGGKPAGIGVKFDSETGTILRNKIETHLAGKLTSHNLTNTM